jgi:hypothetical protein
VLLVGVEVQSIESQAEMSAIPPESFKAADLTSCTHGAAANPGALPKRAPIKRAQAIVSVQILGNCKAVTPRRILRADLILA